MRDVACRAVPDLCAMTRDVLDEHFSKDQLIDLVLELAGQRKQDVARIAELERKLGTPKKDSTNSSNPSSTDRAAKKNQSQRRRSGKKPGGQPGHTGKTRERNPEPDQIAEHRPADCSTCGLGFTGREDERVAERREVIEIPPINTMTTEHRSIAAVCPSGEETRGAFPADVS